MERKQRLAQRRLDKVKAYMPFYLMLLPFCAIFLVMQLIPIAAGMLASFTDFNGLQWPNFIGLENYQRLFLKDEIFKIALRNTLYLALIVGPLGYILSFAVAWFINELGPRLRWVIILMFYVPSISGNLYFIWRYIFSGDAYGVINSFLLNTGLFTKPIAWLSDANYTMFVVIVVSLWTSFNVGFLSFSAGLRGLDRAYYEAAAIDGLKNRWQELYHVTIPQMGPQLLFGAVNSISTAFGLGQINQMLTGNPSTDYSTHTLVLHISEHAMIRFEMGYSSAISMVLFFLMVISWVLVKRLLKNLNAG